MLLLSTFGFSLSRLAVPGVIAGIVLILLGMSILIFSNNINRFMMSHFNLKHDYKLLIKIIALLIVVAGSLTAVFCA